MKKSAKKSPEEKLKRRIRKKVRKQSGFLKHAITYLVLFVFGMAAMFAIRSEELMISFLILFSFWLLGLVFHGLSAFVFHRIDSWEETQYYKKLAELNLREGENTQSFSDPGNEEGMDDDYMDLSSYETLKKKMDERWNEGDLV